MASALTAHSTIAVIGAGTMGASIAQVAAQAGHPVWMVDQNPQICKAAITTLQTGLQKLVDRRKISAEQATVTIANIQPTANQQDLSGCSLVIEAIVEDGAVKRGLFAELMDICGPECIYASNTSSIPIAELAKGLQYPERMVGMHFFNPAQIMKLVEIISSPQTHPDIAAVVYHTAQAWNKVAVHATDSPGFIVNRVARPFYAEALRMVSENMGDYITIDTVMRQAGGFRMGPFELMDLIGHDINYAVTELVSAALNHPLFETSPIQKNMLSKGNLGRKTGCGYYDYSQAQPKLQNTASASTDGQLTIPTKAGLLTPLWQRLTDAGIATSEGLSAGFNDIQLSLHQGAPITDTSKATVAFDIVLDFSNCTAIACQRNPQCYDEQFQALANAFAAAGIFLIEMPNQAGLPVARTLAMLINVAADAVAKKVCTLEDADQAMIYGVNYPQGPFAWASMIGPQWVHDTLANLAQQLDATRYSESPWITDHLLKQRNFYD